MRIRDKNHQELSWSCLYYILFTFTSTFTWNLPLQENNPSETIIHLLCHVFFSIFRLHFTCVLNIHWASSQGVWLESDGWGWMCATSARLSPSSSHYQWLFWSCCLSGMFWTWSALIALSCCEENLGRKIVCRAIFQSKQLPCCGIKSRRELCQGSAGAHHVFIFLLMLI